MAKAAIARPSSGGLRKLLRAAGDAGNVLETLVESSTDGIFVVDAERKLLLFNRRAEAITQFARDEVIGRDCLSGFRCATCLESCGLFERGNVASDRLEIIRRDGRRMQVRKRGAVLRDATGKVIGGVEVFQELGAGEIAESDSSACGAGASWLGAERMMSLLGRGALLLDRQLRFERVSLAFAELVGRSDTELVGTPAADLFGEALFGPRSPFRSALEAGERREGWRATVRRPDGAIAMLSVTGAPIPAGGCGQGQAGGYLIVVRPEDSLPHDGQREDPTTFEGIVSRSASMRRIFQLIDHLRGSDATVLISGESGTGKELIARAIHARSARANQPFVAVNCGALPAELLESELFGHVRGAFTGAVRSKQGRVELAADGTLFLDEIGDLPLPLQVKLLRVLQERTFERVGDTMTRPFRARVVAATHQDLELLVGEKSFRDDLFYRLNVVRLKLPPLRERREDLDVLVAHLMDKISRRRSRILRLSPAAMRTLLEYDWPGNVRQLENALEYATAVARGQTIHREDLPPEITRAAAPRAAPDPSVANSAELAPSTIEPYPTRTAIIDALGRSRHRRHEAARLLGVSRTTLWRRMKQLGLA